MLCSSDLRSSDKKTGAIMATTTRHITGLIAALLLFSGTSLAQFDLTFQVDMRPATEWGRFVPGTDDVTLRGSVSPLTWGADFTLSDPDNDTVYTATVTFGAAGTLEYKYVTLRSGVANWERPSTGNRVHEITLASETLPVVSFDDLPSLVPPAPFAYESDASTYVLYHFEEDGAAIYDASGDGNHGTAYGSALAAGYFGNGRFFNGAGDNIVVNPSTSYSSDFVTWELWFNASGDGTLISRAPEFGDWAQGSKSLFIQGGSIIFEDATYGSISSGPYTYGQWHHVAVTAQLGYLGGASDLVRMYVDGVEVASRGDWDINQFDDNGYVTRIGFTSNNFPIPTFFSGTIDEVRLSNVVRTAAEFNLLSAPQNLSGAPIGTSVSLAWTAGSGGIPLRLYQVYRGLLESSVLVYMGSTTTESFEDTTVASGLTYYYQVVAVDSAGHSSQRSNVAVVQFGTPADLERFEVVANASGDLAQPDMGAFAFNNNGFPTIDGLAPDGVNDRPSPNQQVNGTRWGIHTRSLSANDGTFGYFRKEVTRDGRNWARIYPYDYEIRFTAGTHYAFNPYGGVNQVIIVPFELWNIGQNTPDDQSDDYRMFPYIVDVNGNGAFDFTGVDHPISGLSNDPELDPLYFLVPVNTTPGTAGYQEIVDSILTDPAGHVIFNSDGIGGSSLRNISLVIWNGGDVNDGTFPANVLAQMPEQGTVFRIRTTLDPTAPTTVQRTGVDRAVPGIEYVSPLVSDGYPAPTFSIVSAPPGAWIEGELLKWHPTDAEWGSNEFIVSATNASGSVQDTFYIFVEPYRSAVNQVRLDVSNRGKIGSWGLHDKGFFFNGLNSVYVGDFSLVDRNNVAFAGGLYTEQNSFAPAEAFTDGPSRFPGFASFITSYTDAWESGPRIGTRVIQRTHWKTSFPDDRYVIMEYSIVNEAGGVTIDDLFAQISTDMDIGNSANNLGGQDPDLQLVYAYESDGATNGSFYGFSVLSHPVAGYATWTGSDTGFIRNVTNLTSFINAPSTPGDIRNQISVGPFTLAPSETVTVVFAFVAGNSEIEVRGAASAARSMWNEFVGTNIASVLFDGNGDRIRVLDGVPVKPEANATIFQTQGNTLSVEAWVYPMELPGDGSGRIIVMRPANSGLTVDPYYSYALKIDNYSGDGPHFVFAVTDGVNLWGSGHQTVAADPVNPNIGQWYHLVGTWDGSTARLYVDGVLKTEAMNPITVGPGSVGFYIGGATGDYFNGLIDDVRLWSSMRSEAEIQGNMNAVLTGSEVGLGGYWPLDDAYLAPNGQNATRDKSPYQNDLYVQFDARFVGYPAPDPVTILPTKIQASTLYAVEGEPFRALITADGWPAPTFTYVSGEPWMSGLVGDTLVAGPGFGTYGHYMVVLDATNSTGTLRDTLVLTVEGVRPAENLVRLDVTNRGKLGTTKQYGKGMFLNALNGLYVADFSLVDRDHQMYAGGLYGPYPFNPLSGFTDVPSPLIGFEAFQTEYNDSNEPNRMFVRVVQRTHTKQASPDNRYVLMEYEIHNESGAAIDDLFAQMTADFDLGDSGSNLGGFDGDIGLIYAYDANGTDPNYYGFKILTHDVAGYVTWQGTDYEYVRNSNNLTSMVAAPATPADTRSQISVGPISIPAGGSETVVVAFVAGADYGALRLAADAAVQTWNDPETRNALPVFAETEGNSTVSVADMISLGVRLDGSIDVADDIDYYRFTLATQDTVQIIGTQGEGSELLYRFEIYDDVGSMHWNSAWYYNDQGVAPYGINILNAGTYYLRVMRRDYYASAFPSKTTPAPTPEVAKLETLFKERLQALGTAASLDTGPYSIIVRRYEPVIGKPAYSYIEGVTSERGLFYSTFNIGAPNATIDIQFGQTEAYGQVLTLTEGYSQPYYVYGNNGVLQPLAPATTYHARLRITNPLGVAYGQNRTFTTAPESPLWQNTTVGTNSYEDIHIRSSAEVWIAGEAVRLSTDGGQTWEDRSPYFSFYHYSQELFFLSDLEIVSAGFGTTPVVYTTDGGLTWSAMITDEVYRHLTAVSTPDGVSFVAVGYDNQLVHTPDGGATWSTPGHDNGISSFYDVEYFDGNIVVAVGYEGVIRSTDGGVTWSATNTSVFYGREITPVTSTIGYIAGYDGVYKTTDAGATWTLHNNDGLLYQLSSIHMYNEQEGYAIGMPGRIFQTTDGWTSFVEEESGVRANMTDITAWGNRVMAVGTRGLVVSKGSLAEYEPNSTATEANPVSYNASVDALIDPDTDADYFSFTAAAGDIVSIESRALPESGLNWDGTYIRLYDDVGTQYGSYYFTSAYYYGALDKIVAQVPSAGTYYIKVTSPYSGGQAFPNKTVGDKVPEPLTSTDGLSEAPPKTQTVAPNWTYTLKLTRGGADAPDVKNVGPLVTYTDQAILRGGVMPNGGTTTVTLEYGTTTAFGTTVTAEGMPLSGINYQVFRAPVYGLQPSTTYYYRWVATNEYGTSVSLDTSVLVTPDLPDGWTRKPTDTELPIYDVSIAPDQLTGMIVGAGGYGRITTDRGNSWIPMNLGTTASLFGVKMFDASTAVVVGASNVIRRTTDGGLSWNTVASPHPVTTTYRTLSFADNLNGVAGALSNRVMRTTDGGATWTALPDVAGSVYSIQMIDPNTIVGVTVSGVFFRSDDGGASWFQVGVDSSAGYTTVSLGFFNSLEGLVGTYGGGVVYRTTDGGQTWSSPISIGGYPYFWGTAAITDNNTAWFGNIIGGGVYYTTDQGLTWNVSSIGSDRGVYSIKALTPELMHATTAFGGFFERDTRTIDVTFNVDMRPAIGYGKFKPSKDSLVIRGSVAPIDWFSDTTVFEDLDGDSIYSRTVNFGTTGNLVYKLVIKHYGDTYWEGQGQPLNGDRSLFIQGGSQVVDLSFDDMQPYVPVTGAYSWDGGAAALYHLDEDPGAHPTYLGGQVIFDQSPNGFHGIETNTAKVPGHTGTARFFDGVASVIDLRYQPIASSSAESFTIEGWIYLDTYPTTSVNVFSQSTMPNTFLGVRPGGYLTSGIRQAVDNTMVLDTSTVAVALNEWVHVAMVYDATTQVMHGYINGELQYSKGFTGALTFASTSNYGAFIGAGQTGTGTLAYRFNGRIDEVRISSTARTPAEFNLRLPPANLTAQASASSVTLTWDASAGSTLLQEYRVYRGADSTNMSLLNLSSSTAFTDGSVVTGATYYYAVTAVDQLAFESGFSNIVHVTPLPPPSVLATVPFRNAVAVSGTIDPSIRFSAALDPTTVTTEAFMVYSDIRGTLGLDSVAYDPGTLTVTIYPSVPFFPGERVTMLMKRVIANTNGELIAKPLVLPFQIATTDGNGQFTDAWSLFFPALSDMAVADFDRDGDLDVVMTVPTGTPGLAILENNGQGSFASSSYAVGVMPMRLTAGDFDRDGFPDLAVADNGGGSLSIQFLKGNGDLTFSPLTSRSLSFPTSGLEAGDWDGDGDLDLAIASTAGNYVGILRNNYPTLGFGFSTAGVSNPAGLELVDIEPDADLDLFFLDPNAGTFRALRNDGFGNYPGISNFGGPFEIGATFAATGDLNGDGNPDVVVAEPSSQQLALIRNNGSLSFARQPGFSVGLSLNKLEIGDIDGDGDLDIVAASSTVAASVVYRNNGSFSFSELSYATMGYFPSGNALGDFDGDGDLDLITHVSDGVRLFKNNYDTVPPAAPSNFSASGESGKVNLAWNPNGESDMLRYRMYRSTSVNPTTQIDSVAFGTNTYTDLSVTDSVLYFYRMTAVDASRNESGYSTQLYVTPHAKAQGEYTVDAHTTLLYPFAEKSGVWIADESGPYHLGQATGTSVVPGKFGAGRSFNGTTDYIDVPYSSDFDLGSAYTIEAWFYLDAPLATNTYTIIDKASSDFWLHLLKDIDNTDKVRFRVRDASSIIDVTSSDTVTTGQWHHVAGVIDGAEVRLYLDGKLTGTAAFAGPAPSNLNNTVEIGRTAAGPGDYFNGKIDDIRFSNIARNPSAFNLQLAPAQVAANVSGTTINLSWQNGGGAVALSKYYIYRGLDSASVVLVDSTTSTSYSDADLSASTQYFFRVTAVDVTGFASIQSYAATATTATPIESYVTTFAGDVSTPGFSDGTGTNAFFNNPAGMARDSYGNVYVADAGNHAIRKMTQSGVVTTFAGNGTAGATDGVGVNATFNTPFGIAIDASGNLFVSEWGNHIIRKITPAGQTSIFAGAAGTSGTTDATGASARFNNPAGLAIDASGNLYVADYGNNKIRRITPAGLVTTLAGTGTAGSVNGDPITQAQFNGPVGIAVNTSTGVVYVADEQNHRIRVIAGSSVSTLAGNTQGYADGVGTAALFSEPEGITIGPLGNLYVVEFSNHTVRKVSQSGEVTTVAGDTVQSWQDGNGTIARFNVPVGILADGSGILFVSEQSNNDIRRVVMNFAPTSRTGLPTDVTVTGATLNGIVNPNTKTTSMYFEYGTSTSYGTVAGAQTGLTGTTGLELSTTVSGLTADKTYHYRIVATNEAGTTVGEDRTFVTASPAPLATTLVAPDSAAVNVAVSPTLSWNVSTNATSYLLQVAADAGFTSVLVNDTVASTTTQLSGLQHEVTYYWRVRGQNSTGVSAYSPAWFFTTVVDTPDVPTLVGPVNGATNQPKDITFTWNTSARATSYHLQVSANSAFSVLTYQDTTLTDTSATVAGVLVNSTTYYWRVRAKNTGGTTAYTSTRQFTTIIQAPDVPTLASPLDDATNQPIALTLQWNAAARASTYHVQLAKDTNFTQLVLQDSTLTSTNKSVTALGNDSTYYWRVRAKNAGGTTAYSAFRRFRTIVAPPGTPIALAPDSASIGQAATLALRWSTAARASSYQLQLSTSSSFSFLLVNDSTLTDTSYTAGPLANNQAYFWKVRARNAAGASAYSSVFSFTTAAAVPEVPVLTSPADSAVDQQATLSLAWQASDRATSYRVEVAIDSLFQTIVFVDSTVTATSRAVGPLSYLTTYYWRVRAQNDGGNSVYARYRMFATVNAPPPTPVLLTPDSAATGVEVNAPLAWRKAERATRYELEVSLNSNFSILLVDRDDITDTTFTVGPLLNDTTYYWRVKAFGSGGASAFSSTWQFRTKVAVPPAPTLATPNDNATGVAVSPTLTWNAAARATTYRLEVSTSNTFTPLVFVDSVLTTTSKQVTLQHNTQYFWRVRGQNVGGAGSYSSTRSFVTIIEQPQAPKPVGPDSASVGHPLTLNLTWNTSARAASYALQVSKISSFTTTVVNLPSTTDTSVSVGPLEYQTTYFWRVSATNAGGTSAFSPTWSFETIIEPPPTPSLIVPADLATNLATTLQFAWNAAARAASYRVQVSTNPSFSTVDVDTSGLTGTSVTLSGLQHSSTYFWRVQAVNDGGSSGFSSARQFSTVIAPPAAPSLTNPANNATNVPQGTTFSWASVATTVTYHLQVSTNDAFTALVAEDSTLTGTSKNVSTLTFSAAHFWRVRGKNAGGIGPWSEVRTFTAIPPLPVAAVAPTSLTYGSVEAGSGFTDLTVTLSNEGGQALTATGISISGTDAAQFDVQSGGGAFSLNAGQTRPIVVRFSPVSTGQKTASLVIPTNDNVNHTNGNVVVPLSGEGVDTTPPYNPNLTVSLSPDIWSKSNSFLVSWSDGEITDISGIPEVRTTIDQEPSVSNPGTLVSLGTSSQFSIALPQQGAHQVFFYFVDGLGNSDPTKWYVVTAQFDSTRPTIDHDPASVPEVLVSNGTASPTVAIEASVNDQGGSGVASARVEFRRSSDAVFQSSALPSVVIPSSLFVSATGDPVGVDYRIVATDNAGNATSTKVFSITAKKVDRPEEQPAPQPRVPSSTTSVSEIVRSYRIFSVPYDLADKKPVSHFVASFGDHASNGNNYINWRLQRFVSQTSKQDYEEFKNLDALTPGAGFFLVVRTDQNQFEVQSGVTAVSAQLMNDVGIPVMAGWNLIGTPLNRTIHKDSLRVTAGVIDQWADYTGSGSNNNWNMSPSQMEPWKGLAIHVTQNANLLFRTIGAQPGETAPSVPLAKLQAVSTVKKQGSVKEWTMSVDAVRADGGGVDIENTIGMVKEAKAGKDPYDRYQPPFAGAGSVALYFRTDDESFIDDIRPVSEDGDVWTMDVRTGDEGARVTLKVHGAKELPDPTYEAFLIDLDQRMAYDLKKVDEVSVNSGDGLRHFRIVVGTKAFVKENNAGIDLYPKAFALFNNYPNPFNPETILRYTVADITDASQVSLVVFDVLGREVATVVQALQSPGYYEVPFNAAGLSSGTYFYRLQVLDQQGQQVFSQVKRMLLMK